MTTSDWGGQPGSRLGLDIGGTLTKLAFFESETRPTWCEGSISRLVKDFSSEGAHKHNFGERDKDLSFYDEELAGTFHFVTFMSEQMEQFVSLIEKHALHAGLKTIYATGGGAFKYSKLFSDRLGVVLEPLDELSVVITGIAWLVDRPLRQKLCFLPSTTDLTALASPSAEPSSSAGRRATATPSEGFSMTSPSGSSCSSEAPPTTTLAKESAPPTLGDCTPMRKCIQKGSCALFPFLLVNIGSGVSVVRVDGIDRFERVSGSAIGGGTFWGLCQLLAPDCHNFDEAGRLAEQGDSSPVNLLVSDIYGGDYTLPNGMKLPGSITASYFAKAARQRDPSHKPKEPKEDGNPKRTPDESACCAPNLVHALTKMVSSNICQIAYLNARLHTTPRMVFTGNFLRQNPVARQAISENMERVSTSHMTRGEDPYRVLFLRHEGYFGALGSFLHNVQDPCSEQPSITQAPSHRRNSFDFKDGTFSPPPRS